MTQNKITVQKYMDAFQESDHKMILSCLTENVIWEMPGVYQHHGKEEFDKEIENENFTGKPKITFFRMTEENDVVIAEGNVIGKFKNGDVLDADFCDVFEMENGLIKKLVSYLMQKK